MTLAPILPHIDQMKSLLPSLGDSAPFGLPDLLYMDIHLHNKLRRYSPHLSTFSSFPNFDT